MNLSGNRADTDMLYMKHADGDYRIMLDEDITSTDINQDKEGNEYSGLRFATVGADSDVTFSVGSYDSGGAFNVEYEVGKDVYGSAETAHEMKRITVLNLTVVNPAIIWLIISSVAKVNLLLMRALTKAASVQHLQTVLC